MKPRLFNLLTYLCVCVCLGGDLAHADLGDEAYRLPLVGNYAIYRDDGTFGLMQEKGSYRLVEETPSPSIAAIAAITLPALASATRADFLLESQNLSIDRQTDAADFSLTFNEAPDFQTLDSQGRPIDSFQINFNGNFNPNPNSSGLLFNAWTSAVRGDEIHVANDIRIRSGTGYDPDPNAGGWGPITGSVPFSLIGDTISFSVPAKDLGWTGHDYQYEALSLMDGRQTTSQFATMVPTPAAFPAGVAGLIVTAGATFLIRRRSNQRTG